MAFIPAPATMKVELLYTALGQNCANVIWLRDTEDSISEGLMEDIAAQISLWWTTEMAPLTNDDVVLSQIVVTDWSSESASSISFTANDPGEIVSSILPLNVTFTTSFRTNQRGRSARGRSYFVGLSESQCVGNQIDTAVGIAIRDAWDELETYFTGSLASIQHVVVSFQEDGAPRTTAQVLHVTGYVVHDYNLDSQRRRLTGRGG